MSATVETCGRFGNYCRAASLRLLRGRDPGVQLLLRGSLLPAEQKNINAEMYLQGRDEKTLHFHADPDPDPDPDPTPNVTQVEKLKLFFDFYSQKCQSTLLYDTFLKTA